MDDLDLFLTLGLHLYAKLIDAFIAGTGTVFIGSFHFGFDGAECVFLLSDGCAALGH